MPLACRGEKEVEKEKQAEALKSSLQMSHGQQWSRTDPVTQGRVKVSEAKTTLKTID